jgi:hypothetical protein
LEKGLVTVNLGSPVGLAFVEGVIPLTTNMAGKASTHCQEQQKSARSANNTGAEVVVVVAVAVDLFFLDDFRDHPSLLFKLTLLH